MGVGGTPSVSVLRGRDGRDGPRGRDGRDGVQGAVGPRGYPGMNGPPGTLGALGPKSGGWSTPGGGSTPAEMELF